MAYASYQGKLHLAKIENGVRGALRFVGNVPEFTLETESETVEHSESFTGQRTTDFVLTKSKSVKMSATFEDYSAENLALALSGKTVAVKGAKVTDEALPAVVVGSEVKLGGFNLSAVTVKDNAGASLKLNEDYTLDEKFGKLTFLKSNEKQPLTVDYTTGAVNSTTLMSADDDRFYLYFEGVNTVDNKPIVLELWNVQKEIGGSVPFIHEELGSIEINGSALSDSSKASDPALGLFGRVVVLD